MKVDHLMWACPDLDIGIKAIHELTGVSPEYSGSHQNMGTRNALLSLGTSYLEIIAPDPGQQLMGNFGARLSKLRSSGLVALAMQRENLQNLRSLLKEFSTSDVMPTKRQDADGKMLNWDLLFVAGVTGAPFYIDWLDCEHPSQTSPVGCKLYRVNIDTPQLEKYRLLTQAEGETDPCLVLKDGDAFSIAAMLDTPKGIVRLEPLQEPIRLF